MAPPAPPSGNGSAPESNVFFLPSIALTAFQNFANFYRKANMARGVFFHRGNLNRRWQPGFFLCGILGVILQRLVSFSLSGYIFQTKKFPS
jgi:hypothetical protein